MKANTIKTIAIVAMLIDHIAWGFVSANSLLGIAMHLVGRTTAPIMCYFIAEGYFHTHDVKRYALRLGLFAVLSQISYILFERGSWIQLNVIFGLLLGLCALLVWKEVDLLRITVVVVVCFLAFLFSDWGAFAVLWVLAFGINHGNFKKQCLWFSVISLFVYPFYGQLFQFGVFLALPLLALYNGQRGGGKYSKWGFYIFYPAHLLVLGLLRLI